MKCKYAILIVLGLLFPISSNAGGKNNFRIELPTMGWSSWNTYRVNISDSLIMKQADAMVSKGLKDVGYQYVNIDDGFFGGRNMQTGELYIHPVRFPNGLKPVVDHIHNLGLKAGIYSDAGANTCGNYYDNDTIAKNVGLYRFERRDADFFFRQLGYDFIKIDDCGFRSHKNHEHRGLDTEERYRTIHEAIINVHPVQPVRVNVCRKGFPGKWVYDVATSWRISHDIRPRWSSVRGIIDLNLYLSAYARKGCYNDMDMLEIGRGMSDEEDRTHFGMWCVMSSPLLIGCDMTNLKDKTLALLKNEELIAVNQDPLGLQAEVVSRNWQDSTIILVKDLLELGGKSRAVAFYNYSDHPQKMCIGLDSLLLGGKVTVRDLFEHKTLKSPAKYLATDVPAHGVRIYKLTGERRLEQTRYEAEAAFLSCFQQLYNPVVVGTAYYKRDPLCSGGMKVTGLGGRAKNDIIWENVYSQQGGLYTITVHLANRTKGRIMASVNDMASMIIPVTENDTVVSFQAALLKGHNEIRLFDDQNPMPEIDYISITPSSTRP